MTRLILLGSGCLALVGCSVAMAQGAPVASPADMLGPLAGTGGVVGMGGAAWVAREALRLAADIGGELRTGRELVSDIKAELAAQNRVLQDILVEQRASKAANEANGGRLDRIEDELDGIERAMPRHRETPP